MWQVEVPAIIAICRSSGRRPVGGGGAQHAQRAGMGVDQAHRDAAAGGEAQLLRGLGGQRAEIAADRRGALRQAAALDQVADAASRRGSPAARPRASWAR